MMKNTSIICVSMTTWDGDYMKSVVHLMGHLAKKRPVLFVDYAFTWKDVIFALIGKSPAPISRMMGWRSRLRSVSYKDATVHHLTLPPSLPINWIKSKLIHDRLLRLQGILQAWIIRKACRKLEFENSTVINAFNPSIGWALKGRLNENRTLYYCYDEISASPWCKNHGARIEKEFGRYAEAIITTSTHLKRTKSEINPNTHLVRNGVDFELFNSVVTKERSKKKVLGYLGSVDFRLDHKLISLMACALPEYEIHVVGRICSAKIHKQLSNIPNIRFFGAQEPEHLPGFMEAFDCAMIPFVCNDFTKGIYPLKINEYLAAGIPVVSTNFSNLQEFSALVQITNDPEIFIKSIKKSIENDSTQLRDRRTKMAMANDWSVRARQFESILADAS